jgi:hypothetical protein
MKHLVDNWAIIIAILGVIGTIYQYFDKKKWERRWKEFEVYHKLIKRLTNLDCKVSLNEQVAIVSELLYFKRYYPISLRILNSQKSLWQNQSGNSLLIEEIEITIKEMIKEK